MGRVELDGTEEGLCPVAGPALVVLNLLPKKYRISEVASVCVYVSVHWHPPMLQVCHMVSALLPVLIPCHHALLYMLICKYSDGRSLVDVENTVGCTNL
jgi:hypothetical protein